MSSNVVKANFIQFSPENIKVIESDSLVAKRLEGFSGVFRELEPEVLDNSPDIDPEEAQMLASLLSDPEEDGFKALDVESVDTEKIRESALAEIEEMKARAFAEIEELKNNTYLEAKENGYRDGVKMAEAEYSEGLATLERERAGLDAQYEAMVKEIEPKMVQVITGVYKKVFGDSFYNKADVMANLIHKALLNVSGDEDIVIHVSSEDYEEILAAKDAVLGRLHFNVEPELRPEERLATGEAKVENAHGIIDCSIDTELTELTKMLRVLSYEGHE